MAARAGVSWKTVTNVVHQRPNVAEATRERVQAAIHELGYRPVLLGRALRDGRSHALTLVVPDVVNPYFAMLIEAVFAAAATRGYAVFVESAGRVPDVEERAASSVLKFAFDGVLFSPTFSGRAELVRLAERMPVVLLGEASQDAPLDRVTIDNAAGAAAVTRHLIDGGRRRIAFVGDRPDGPSQPGGIRARGWADALRAAGLDPEPALLLPVEGYHLVDGAAAASRLLELGCDAAVCANDLLALGLLHGLRRAGVDVPGQVAVTGWDDVPEAAYCAPTLTSVAPDIPALAAAGVDRLVDRIEGAEQPIGQVVVPHRVVVRESSGSTVSSG